VVDVLERAASLLATPAEVLAEQRRAEFASYWNISADGKAIVSLLSPQTPFGVVTVWDGARFSLVASSDDEARIWLARRFGPDFPIKELAHGVYLPGDGLDDQLTSAATVIERAAPYTDAKHNLEKAACKWRRDTVVVFRLPGDFALAGGRVRKPNPPQSMHKTPPIKGFREGHAPATVAVPVYFGPNSVFERAILQRADAPWVLARGGESFDERLQSARVCLIGAGALGSGVARLLVKAGIGHLRIIDSDWLKLDNIARHDLGADHLGEAKAKALAAELMKNYPFAEVLGIDATWQKAYRDDNTIFDCDLVLSTTASWPDEAQLNSFFRSAGNAVPLAFGWIEAHASAAHVLVTFPDAGCMACGFTASGEFVHAVTEWKKTVLKMEPSCGTAYAPYSNLAATRAQALITQEVLAVLKGDIATSSLATEVYDKSLRVEDEGVIREEAVQRLGHQPSDFGERWQTDWPRNPECGWCKC
jgi:molybdopterin/thiamine biosynthesis adenylyltransferase